MLVTVAAGSVYEKASNSLAEKLRIRFMNVGLVSGSVTRPSESSLEAVDFADVEKKKTAILNAGR